MLEQINLALVCHDHQRVILDIHHIGLLLLLGGVVNIEKFPVLFLVALLHLIFVRVFYEVIVHDYDVFLLNIWLVQSSLSCLFHFYSAAVVQEFLGKIWKPSD